MGFLGGALLFIAGVAALAFFVIYVVSLLALIGEWRGR